MKEDCLRKEIKYNETPKHNLNASLFQLGFRREFRPKQKDVNNFSISQRTVHRTILGAQERSQLIK